MYPLDAQWTYTDHDANFPRTTSLSLSWRLNGDHEQATSPFVSAPEALDDWLRRYGHDLMPIHWTIAETTDAAPFQGLAKDFLSAFSWPTHHETQEPVNFNRLRVLDRHWTPEKFSVGGFIQEATGWKPAPLQPVFDTRRVLQAAGLAMPQFVR